METGQAYLAFLQIEYLYAEPETYALPLGCAFGEKADASTVTNRRWSFPLSHD